MKLKTEIQSNEIIVRDLTRHIQQWIDYPDTKSIQKHQL